MKQAWAALGARDGALLQTELLARYAEPHRAYHTQQHLAECLALFDEIRVHAEQPAEIEIALWFHDAVYDVHRHDNEARSADWARTALLQAGAASDAADRVAALVMATRHSFAPQTPDEQLLVDIDLAILGAAPARFDEYERQVRAEYAHVAEADFRAGRARVLAGFLARPRLYATQPFHDALEQRARENLGRSLAALRA